MKIKYYLLPILFTIPILSFAQGEDVWSLWDYLLKLVQDLTAMFWVIAILSFLWGLVLFMSKVESAADQKKGVELMKGSVIAFTIAVSFWGMVTFLINSSTLNSDNYDVPHVDSNGQRY